MTYHARMQGDVVAEVSDLSAPPAEMFHPDLAHTWQQCDPAVKPGWTRQGDTLAAPVLSLEHAKGAAQSALAAQLAQHIAAGMPWHGRTLQIDEVSQNRLSAAMLLAVAGVLPTPFAWRMADNIALPMDAAGLREMASAAAAYVGDLHARWWAATDAVAASTTVAAAQAVVVVSRMAMRCVAGLLLALVLTAARADTMPFIYPNTDAFPGTGVVAPGANFPSSFANKVFTTVARLDLADRSWIRHVQEFAPCDGVSDAAPGLALAGAALVAQGGGTLLVTGRCVIDSADLIIPESVTLQGTHYPGLQRQFLGYDGVTPALIVNPAHTIRVSSNARLRDIFVVRKGMVTPTDMRSAVIQLAAFAGTGITIGTNPALYVTDGSVEDVAMVGFDRCIDVGFVNRARIRSVYGDCNNGVRVDNSHDDTRIGDVHWWPTLTADEPWAYPEWAIASTSNVSGHVRVVTSTPHTLVTGDWVNVIAPGTMPSNRVAVSVVDATTLDLVGTTYAGAYAGSGKVVLDLIRKDGLSFEVTNSEGTEILDSFGYGFEGGMHLGTGSGWTHLVNVSCDSYGDYTQDPNGVCLRIDGTAYGTSAISGVYVSAAAAVIVNSTGQEGHSLVGLSINPHSAGSPSPMVQVLQGRLTMVGNRSPQCCLSTIAVSDAGYADLTGNTLPSTSMQYQSLTASYHTSLVGNTLAPGQRTLQVPLNGRSGFALYADDVGGLGVASLNVNGCAVLSGAGVPAVTAPVCTQYYRTDGGPGATLYVKESGTGPSGWTAK